MLHNHIDAFLDLRQRAVDIAAKFGNKPSLLAAPRCLKVQECLRFRVARKGCNSTTNALITVVAAELPIHLLPILRRGTAMDADDMQAKAEFISVVAAARVAIETRKSGWLATDRVVLLYRDVVQPTLQTTPRPASVAVQINRGALRIGLPCRNQQQSRNYR